MTINLSQRVQSIKPSATLAVSARAAELKAAGHDIIDLGLGEPDFDTPTPIKQAAIKAIEGGFTKYTAVDGTVSLKKAISEKLVRENNLHYQPNQIMVSCGAKQCIYNLTQALLNPGDEVIIPAPYWVSYPDIVLLAGATPVIVTANIEQNFKITPEQLQAAITPKTKLFIINSPSNPTGMTYTRAELQALGEVLIKHPDIVIMTDDIYEHIRWTQEPFANIVNACTQLYDRTIIVNGVSKVYAMTGWRIGYAAGPVNIIAAMKKIQSQVTSNPCSISQVAAQQGLSGDQSSVSMMREAFHERHQIIYQRLNKMPGIQCPAATGAFYSFPRIEGAIKLLGLKDDVQFSEYLLEKAGLAVVPGSAFGLSGYIRLSYVISTELLNQALDRLEDVLVTSQA